MNVQDEQSGLSVLEVLGRSDYAIISNIIEPNTRVLDAGCGDGELLEWLAENKGVDGRGIEISGPRARRAIARGVPVYQGDVDQGLTDYPDQAFDYVILSQTLQETRNPLQVMREMLRVGRRAVVAFPNFGNWRVRMAHLISGRAPKTKLFPHDWYDSPNIHVLSVKDFIDVCGKERWIIERAIYLAGQRQVRIIPDLMAETAVFLVRR